MKVKGLLLVASVVLLSMFVCACGNSPAAQAQTNANTIVRGNPFDWSHRHVISTGDQAMQGSKLALREPRFAYAWLNRKYREQHRKNTPSATTQQIDWNHNLGAAMADGSFPAKYSFNLSGEAPTCSDFVVYGLNVAGSSSRANLIGLTNLYSGTAGGTGLCNNNSGVYQRYPDWSQGYAATLKFAYNGSTIGGTITNSIVLAEDGSKIAYVESNASNGTSVLHVVSIPSGVDGTGSCYGTDGKERTSCGDSATVPSSIQTVPSSQSWASTDSYSSVWVDYTNDIAYVGTDNGVLHKIANVFCTTSTCIASSVSPSEVSTGGWPVTLSGAGALTSPVEDANGVLYVAGASSGKIYAVTSAGVVTTSSQTFMASSIVDGPMLDIDSNGVTQALYWFSNSQSSSSTPSVRQPQLVQTDSSLTMFNNYSLILNGTSSWPTDSTAAVTLHSGTFDNDFYTNRAGNMWTCGWWTNGQYQGNHLGLIRFAINGTTVTPYTSTVYQQLSPDWISANTNTCSPITEVLDGTGVDRVFVANRVGYSLGNCSNQSSCISGYTVTSSSGTYSLNLAASYNLQKMWNNSAPQTYSSGIIIDNVVDPSTYVCGINKNETCAQAASVYLMQGQYAVKLTQNALQ